MEERKKISMEGLLSGLETKFTNVIRRIDSDIKALWRSSDVLNKKYNAMAIELEGMKAEIPVFVSKPEKPTDEKAFVTVLKEYFGMFIEKCVNFYNENQKLALGLLVCLCVYNVLSLFSYITICVYVCGKKNAEKKSEKPAESENNSSNGFPIPDRISPPLLPEPSFERKSPSPPPVPQPDMPDMIEIPPPMSACVCVGDDLPPRPPMRTFSLPKNYQMRSKSGLPRRNVFMGRLTPVSSPQLPRAVIQPNAHTNAVVQYRETSL